ncbi:MAG: hypothetical protein FH762_19640 [Firmicutes bacterium]|nr:hypothetical protein [Bacillota bacterium]
MPWTYIDDVLVDATTSESPTFSNRVTDKPVEEGGSIADHVENQPTTLPLECTITGEEGATADEKYERLLEITQQKEIIEVVGALQVYENMVIEEFNPVKDSAIENGFRCSITLKQIRVVEQETIQVELGVDPVTGTQAQGDNSKTDIRDPGDDDVDEDTLSSILSEIIGAASGDNDSGDDEE